MPLVWLLIIVVVVYGIFHLPFFSIKQVQIIGNANSSTVTSLDSLIGTTIFSHSVTTNIDHIKNADLTIDTLDCRKGIPSTLRCTVTYRSPSIIWKRGDNQFLVDSDGFVYAPKIADSTVLMVDDRTQLDVKVGTTVADSDIIGAYQSIKDELTKRGFTVTNLFVADALQQVGAIVTGNDTLNWHPATPINFLLVTSYPISSQADILQTTVQTKAPQITNRVDVRVPGYVYIK